MGPEATFGGPPKQRHILFVEEGGMLSKLSSRRVGTEVVMFELGLEG